MFDARKLFEFACPIHSWTSQGSSFKRLRMQHSTYPTSVGETHDVASKFPVLRNASFRPCFHVTCLNHFSHTLIPDMQNFVPWILPANPTWSSNRASDHTSKVNVKFFHIGTMNALGPSPKTSNWCHDGIEEFQFGSDGHISFGSEKSTCWQRRRDLQIANDTQYPELHFLNRLKTTCNPTICDPIPFPLP